MGYIPLPNVPPSNVFAINQDGGFHAGLQLDDKSVGGTPVPVALISGLSGSFAGLWLAAHAALPLDTNQYAVFEFGTVLRINGPNGGVVSIRVNDIELVTFDGNAQQKFATGFAPNIDQVASAGVAQDMTITAQASGGANDGGGLNLVGGAGAGANDGPVRIKSPLNTGFYTFVPAAGANNLTNAQSDQNMFITSAAVLAGAYTVNFKREITDTSLLFFRNNANTTATIAYVAGGTVTVPTNTAALIVSDGVNLQVLGRMT